MWEAIPIAVKGPSSVAYCQDVDLSLLRYTVEGCPISFIVYRDMKSECVVADRFPLQGRVTYASREAIAQLPHSIENGIVFLFSSDGSELVHA